MWSVKPLGQEGDHLGNAPADKDRLSILQQAGGEADHKFRIGESEIAIHGAPERFSVTALSCY